MGLLEYFSDEYENGKLYINYPMIESYKDVVNYNPHDYYDQFIHVNKSKTYKNYLNSKTKIINSIRDLTKNKLEYIIYINLTKSNFYLNSSYKKPTQKEFIDRNELNLFLYIEENYISSNNIPVLNCLIYIVIDYISEKERSKFLSKGGDKQ